jgi:anaerobic magnesium-protoporphyrin IX monomethyl ester cyclase
MVRLALVNPGKDQSCGVHEPLNLLTLAAYAKKFGHDVIIADQIAGDNVFKKIEEFKPDFVGITGTTAVIADAYEIADWCKSKGHKTILGGVHVTIMPEEGLKHADFVVCGEGEDALVKILSGEAKEGIVKGEIIKDLDSLPKLDRELVNVNFYQTGRDRVPGAHLHFVPKGHKLSSILAQRGCPYRCIFCHNSWRGLPIRFNSAKHIIDEMKELEDKYGVQAIFFMDDDFLFSKSRNIEFCKLYKEAGLKMIWGCQTRVTSVDLELLKAIKAVNCLQINYGFESGSQRILSLLKNNMTTVEQNREAIKLTKEAGILACGTFMIGNPTETEEDIEMTKKFVLENEVDGFGVAITTPYPGTKLWEMCKEKGVIPDETKIDWRKFNFYNLTFALCDIPREKIERKYQELLDIALAKNPSLSPKGLFKYAIRHPNKVIKRLVSNPKILMTFMSRVIKSAYKDRTPKNS